MHAFEKLIDACKNTLLTDPFSQRLLDFCRAFHDNIIRYTGLCLSGVSSTALACHACDKRAIIAQGK